MPAETAEKQQPLPEAATQGSREVQSKEGQSSGLKISKVPCRFWGTKNGCRAGTSCTFYHDPAAAPATVQEHNDGAQKAAEAPGKQPVSQSPGEKRRLQAPVVDPSRVVARPRPQTQQINPREFQLQQLKRRFAPSESSTGDETSLEIKMPPSDPDFPFEMDHLDCVLKIPKNYPGSTKPNLRVKNKEMSRGYQIKIENGFNTIVREFPNSTLLGWMNILDRRLEELLTGEKTETIKLVANRGPPKATEPSPVGTLPETPTSPEAVTAVFNPPKEKIRPSYRQEELAAASQQREAQTRQLESRLGRLPLYFKSSDGLGYTLPIEPRRRKELPVLLQSVKTLRLKVPALYPLETCTIELQGVDREAASTTEAEFEKRAIQTKEDVTLMAHVNYLAQNMHVFAAAPDPRVEAVVPELVIAPEASKDAHATSETAPKLEGDDYRSHIHIIPRPPEWEPGYNDTPSDSDTDNSGLDSAADSASNSDSDGQDEQDGSDAADAGASASAIPALNSGPERGVALSFPNILLQNISLLTLTSLSITVLCSRCKTSADATLAPSSPANLVCGKCSSALSVAFRPELVHVNSARAGYLDLSGCTVTDLLPSRFEPVCADCGAAYRPGLVGVRGDSALGVCRDCHRHLRLGLPEVKFLIVSAGSKLGLPPRKRAPKETLGIVAGTALPNDGLCPHYRHSHRWFRFGCCAKVYPCDKCHDKEAGHPYEHGNRMICGWCSREQNYRPEACGFCGRWVVRSKGHSGFWEGGRGTRDHGLMRKKEGRKYKKTAEAKKKIKTRSKGKEWVGYDIAK